MSLRLTVTSIFLVIFWLPVEVRWVACSSIFDFEEAPETSSGRKVSVTVPSSPCTKVSAIALNVVPSSVCFAPSSDAEACTLPGTWSEPGTILAERFLKFTASPLTEQVLPMLTTSLFVSFVPPTIFHSVGPAAKHSVSSTSSPNPMPSSSGIDASHFCLKFAFETRMLIAPRTFVGLVIELPLFPRVSVPVSGAFESGSSTVPSSWLSNEKLA